MQTALGYERLSEQGIFELIIMLENVEEEDDDDNDIADTEVY